MRVIAKYKGEEILLKSYKSYLDLDKDLCSFETIGDLMKKLELDETRDKIIILDNNGNQISINPDIIRNTISLYDNNQGEKFAEWIVDSASNLKDNYYGREGLFHYFCDRLVEFTNYKSEDEFDINDINNREGKRLYLAIKDFKDDFINYGQTPFSFELFRRKFINDISKYVYKDREYNYGYMRKLVSALTDNYGFILDNQKDNNKKLNLDRQEKVLKNFKTAIHNHEFDKKQISIADLGNDEEKIIYDENGIKIDEKEFLEEFTKSYVYKGN